MLHYAILSSAQKLPVFRIQISPPPPGQAFNKPTSTLFLLELFGAAKSHVYRQDNILQKFIINKRLNSDF
jgi:hypothetical protein